MEVIQTNILSDKHYQEKKKRGKTALLMLKYLRISEFQNYSENFRIKRFDTILMFLSLWSLSFCNHV